MKIIRQTVAQKLYDFKKLSSIPGFSLSFLRNPRKTVEKITPIC